MCTKILFIIIIFAFFTRKSEWLDYAPFVRLVQVVRRQQNLAHLWVLGYQMVLAVLGILVYPTLLIHLSALVVLCVH